MKADYLSYRRATSVALLGLALQGVLGLAILIYGFVARGETGLPAPDEAAQTGGIFILLGIPIWLLLAIVFDQHRRERIEALENEALIQSGARDSSAFAEGADDFRIAHKRLMWMHRVMIPSASVVIALLWIAAGLGRYYGASLVLKSEAFQSSANFGWPIAIGLFLAFTGFVFARYVAGMAKQPMWASLRAGAAMSVAAALSGLLLALAQFVDYVGPNTAIRWLHIIFPTLIIVVGAEFFLNFLLGLYRPRKAGEVPPPAFNSRLLGFAAAPDRIAESIGGAINYQFGFDVTSSWFYQLISRSLLALVGVGVLVLWSMTCLTIVQSNEQGVRLRFGEPVGSGPLQPGAYFKLPWPLEIVETFPATAARRIDLGGPTPNLKGKSILWTAEHGITESYFAVQPAAVDHAGESEATPNRLRDVALVSVEVPLIYVVNDLLKFEKFASRDTREDVLKAIARRETFRYLATQSADQVLGEKRSAISQNLLSIVQKRFDDLDIGIRAIFVGIEGVHPPKETAASFESIVKSGQQRQASIQSAETEANGELIRVAGTVAGARRLIEAIRGYEALKQSPLGQGGQAERDRQIRETEVQIEELLSKAGGEAAIAIQNARAERWSHHMLARGQAESQEGRLAAFKAAPQAYITQVYFRTLQEMMSKSRVYILADSGKTEVRTNLEESDAGGNIFTKPKESP